MALPGTTCCGKRSQCTMFAVVFRSMPATYWRLAICASGGPTMPLASTMPGMVWHEPQPSLTISAWPAVAASLVDGGVAAGALQPPSAMRARSGR